MACEENISRGIFSFFLFSLRKQETYCRRGVEACYVCEMKRGFGCRKNLFSLFPLKKNSVANNTKSRGERRRRARETNAKPINCRVRM